MKTKVALIVLLVALGILGWYCYQQGPAVQQELDVAREDLRVASNQVVVTSSQLTLMSNQLATAKAEIVKVKTQLAVVKESVQEKPVTTAKTGKPKGDRTGPPSSHTKTADARGTDTKQSPPPVSDHEAELQVKLATVTKELTKVRQQLTDSEYSKTTTEQELKALRGRYTALELEKESLLRQLNDLAALKAQIRLVEQRLRQTRIEASKRADQRALETGNRGMMMKDGQWRTVQVLGTASSLK